MKLVFVSSTFKDMQSEQDLLQTYIIPSLNEKLKEHGEKLYFEDLCWEETTIDPDSNKDNCKPYVIVLVGERYGRIPEQELIDEAGVLNGALLNPEYEGRILFYFRNLDKSGMTQEERRDYEAESEKHFTKVEELKKRIKESYPEYIRCYNGVWDAENKKVSGLEDFVSQVQKDVGDILLRDIEAENNLPWQERSMQAADRYFKEVNKKIVPVKNYEVRYLGSAVTEGEASFIYVTGEEGSGKSAMVISNYCAWEGEKLAFSFGIDKFSQKALDFERILVYKLETILGYEHKVHKDVKLEKIIFDYLSCLKEPIGIYIDNADSDFLAIFSSLESRWRIKENCASVNARFVIGMQKRLPFYPFFERSTKVVMRFLSDYESEQVLEGIIKNNHMELAPIVKSRILSKSGKISAAYLQNMVKRLMILDSEDFAAIRAMGDGKDNIDKYMISIVDNASEGRYGILEDLIEEAENRINRIFIERIIELFTHVPVALTAEDIQGIFKECGWEFNRIDFFTTVRMLEGVLNYNHYYRSYKIKNKDIEQTIYRNSPDWDPVPVAEYMLRDDKLRPFAFRAAVSGATPEYLISVLKRSQITDITQSICHLLELGHEQKAIDTLIAIAKNEEFKQVRLLPAFQEIGLRDPKMTLEFFGELSYIGEEHLTNDTNLLFALVLEANLEMAEYALTLDPSVAIKMLLKTDALIRHRGGKIKASTLNRVHFLILRAVNKTKSKELFDKLVIGEEYFDYFHYSSEYDKTILNMKAYTEFAELVNVFDKELSELYYDKAYDLAVKADAFLCKGEDFEYVAENTQDIYWILVGKTLNPLDLNMLRGEIRVNYRGDQADSEDIMYKACEMWLQTRNKMDCIWYWRSMALYFAQLRDNGEDLDENQIETCIFHTQYLIGWGLKVSDYVNILHCADLLEDKEAVERLLEAARCEGELENIIQDMIRYYYIDGDMDKFLALKKEFQSKQDNYMGHEHIAAKTVQGYFEMLTEK